MRFALFSRRVAAYRALFAPNDGALTPMAETVLRDLRRFCFADGSTTAQAADSMGRIDPLRVATAEGRRQVWLRLVEHLGPGADRLLQQLAQAEARERDPLSNDR